MAARVALPLPLARPFGAYAFMLTCISRYSGGLHGPVASGPGRPVDRQRRGHLGRARQVLRHGGGMHHAACFATE